MAHHADGANRILEAGSEEEAMSAAAMMMRYKRKLKAMLFQMALSMALLNNVGAGLIKA